MEGIDRPAYQSHDEQQAAIECYLKWRNRARDISVTAWQEYQQENAKPTIAA